MSLPAVASAAAVAASTSLSSVNPRRSSSASRVPAPLRRSLSCRLLSSPSSSYSGPALAGVEQCMRSGPPKWKGPSLSVYVCIMYSIFCL
ncbi:unnamed protein product [Urochloa humidicola]